jgi:hypothetical protein
VSDRIFFHTKSSVRVRLHSSTSLRNAVSLFDDKRLVGASRADLHRRPRSNQFDRKFDSVIVRCADDKSIERNDRSFVESITGSPIAQSVRQQSRSVVFFSILSVLLHAISSELTRLKQLFALLIRCRYFGVSRTVGSVLTDRFERLVPGRTTVESAAVAECESSAIGATQTTATVESVAATTGRIVRISGRRFDWIVFAGSTRCCGRQF